MSILWASSLLAGVTLVAFFLLRMSVQLHVVQQDIALLHQMLVTWATTWGAPQEEVRQALVRVLAKRGIRQNDGSEA